MLASSIIKTSNLSKIFNQCLPNEVRAVDKVSIDLPVQSCTLLGGASGSGKSTLLAILSCLSKPTEGEYICLGEKVSKWSEKFLTVFRQRHIGVVFQHFQLVKGLTVRENIALPLLPQNYSYHQISQAVVQAAEQANIVHRLDFQLNTLSGGELQRTAIARAIVNSPTLLFADEPTSHLDSQNAIAIMNLFESLKKQGKTLIITSHDSFVQAHSIFDQKVLLKDGKVMIEN